MVNAGILMELKLVAHTQKSRIGHAADTAFISTKKDYFLVAFGYLIVISLSKLSAWSTSFITHSM
jgi:hypothetical protein